MERRVEKVTSLIPTAPKRLRVAAYTRVSSGKDAMLHSLSEQADYYDNMIRNRREWIFSGIYLDEAITGTKSERPSFQQMLSDCRDHKIDMIITKSISRFARNTVTMLNATRELTSLGVDVFFEEQNLHTISKMGEFVLTCISSVAQEEARSVSENMKWRYHHGFEMGELLGLSCMFGYKITKDRIEINEDEAEIVREVYRRVIDGDSFGSIARDMELRGVKRRLGGRWTEVAIHQMIENEKYTGNSILQKTYVNNYLEKRRIKNVGQLRQYYVENSHPAIVSMETYKEANRVLKRLKEERSRWTPMEHTVFTSKLTCDRCGKNFSRITRAGTKYYQCGTYLTKGKAACPAQRIPERELYEVSRKAMGLKEFSEAEFQSKIDRILVQQNKNLVFLFKTGDTVTETWQQKSRSESWTPEMRERARERYEKRGKKDA